MPILNMIYWAIWWGGWWWQPWANTLLYYTFDWDVLDHSPSWLYDWTRWGTAAYTTWLNGKQCGDFSLWNDNIVTASCSVSPDTVSLLMKWNMTGYDGYDRKQIIWITTTWENSWCLRAIPRSTGGQKAWKLIAYCSWWWIEINNPSYVDNDWHHYCLTTDWTTSYLYFDWTLIGQKSWDLTAHGSTLCIWRIPWSNQYKLNWCIQNLILESAQWSAQDITDYCSEWLWS